MCLWNLVESCGIHFQILCNLTKTTLTTFLFAWCARSFQCQCSRNSASDPSHGWRAWNSILSMLRYSAWTMLTQAVPQKLGVFLFQSEFQSVSVSSDVTFDSAPSWRLLGAFLARLGLTKVLVRTSRLCWTGVDRLDKRCYKICSSFKRPGLLQARGRLSVLPCAKRLDLQS